LPAIPLAWLDATGAVIDFSSGYTFSAKVCAASTTAVLLTKSSGITGAATSPNLTIDWVAADFSGLTASATGTAYDVFVYARRTADSKDRVFNPAKPLQILLFTAPA
jgi:hypothetical protein